MSSAAAELGGGFEWGPNPILNVDQAAEILAERLQAAYDDLEAQRLRTITGLATGNATLTARNLEELQTALAVFIERAGEEVRSFLDLHLGPRYEEGGRFAAAEAFTWTQAHRQALTSLAIDTFEDFLARAEAAQQVTEAFARAVRKAAATEIPKIAAGGRTARQVADQLEARLLRQYGIAEVTYADGSRVEVRTYARMVARTKSAVAYNAGTLNQAHADGVTHVEIFDGSDCGWTAHDDPDKANGTVRPIRVAANYAIAHPNCLRSFGPRPDVTTDEQAKTASPSTTAAQRADQAASERAAATASRVRPAQLRRARLQVQRQARMLGVASDTDVAGLIDKALRDQGLI